MEQGRIRLEYNPECECQWHIEPDSGQPSVLAARVGWAVIVKGYPETQANVLEQFTEWVDSISAPLANDEGQQDYPDADGIREMFLAFDAGWRAHHTEQQESAQRFCHN